MAWLNRVFLAGRLTRDYQCRYTAGGKAVGRFGLAIDRKYHRPDGEEVEEVCFVEVQLVGDAAEHSRDFLDKGVLVLVEGWLVNAEWKDRRGVKHSRLQVLAKDVQFLAAPVH